MRIISLCFVFSFFILFSCSKEENIYQQQYKTRTVLAYIAADNDLSAEAKSKCEALLTGWNASMGKLLVVTDDGKHPPLLLQATMSNDQKQWDTLRVYTHDNMADRVLLTTVIADMSHFAPADTYGFIVFSHATGWLPAERNTSAATNIQEAHMQGIPKVQGEGIVTRALIKDGTHDMNIDDFAGAIPDHRFTFIAFDMCFMANVEALYSLRNKADYFIASATEILSPGFTPIYRTHLSKLFCTRCNQPRPLIAFATAYFDYWNKQEGIYRSATISVIRASAFEEMAELSRHILFKNSLYKDLSSQRSLFQPYDRYSTHLFFDFSQYLNHLALTAEQRKEIDRVMNHLVIYKNNTSHLISLPIIQHSGLSVYIDNPYNPALNKAHNHTDWQKRVISN